MPQTGGLKQQTFIVSQVLRVEVWDQGALRPGFWWRTLIPAGRPYLTPLTLSLLPLSFVGMGKKGLSAVSFSSNKDTSPIDYCLILVN